MHKKTKLFFEINDVLYSADAYIFYSVKLIHYHNYYKQEIKQTEY